MANDNDATAVSTAANDRDYAVEKMARIISNMPNGERAKLRRAYLHGNFEAEGIIAGVLHRIGMSVPTRPEYFHRWKLLAHTAALLAGTGEKGAQSHSREKSLGAAIHGAGIKEDRLLRLISARGAILDTLVVRTMRRIARQDTRAINLFTLSDLLSQDETKSESARLWIAREYYAAEAQAEKGDGK